jgi:hypothetical protein
MFAFVHSTPLLNVCRLQLYHHLSTLSVIFRGLSLISPTFLALSLRFY